MWNKNQNNNNMKTKRLFVTAVMVAALALNANAQQVFKEIYNSANATLTNPKEDAGVRKIALFKVDALTYMNTKYLEVVLDTINKPSYNVMARRDSMAYFMYDYINLFMKEYNRAGKTKQKDKVMKIFRESSINNPLFNDPDREYVLAYFNREDFVTQFSLDTNWVKACADVRKKLQEM